MEVKRKKAITELLINSLLMFVLTKEVCGEDKGKYGYIDKCEERVQNIGG